MIGHGVAAVGEICWSGRQNGELLQLTASRLDLFVTADQNVQYRQNLSSLPLSIAVLAARDSRFEMLSLLTAQLLVRLANLPAHLYPLRSLTSRSTRTPRRRRLRAVRSAPASLVRYASGTQRRRKLWNWELSLLAWL